MQFTILAISAFAATVLAAPYGDSGSSGSSGSSSNTCAQGSEISCCVTNSADSGTLGNVLGGSCLLDQVSLLSALDNQCPAGNTFCCPTNQDGTLNINVSCVPINL
ncbi:hypothetical protein M409DRAFT_21615 [Zasmidium cellare ATCC 36951]|uniref:Hydrophobin n=1 Tax=Zasmidium cellare ATCC 36951 TaxID=1080233 RepID=A0A6A6CMA0_ZASCE|nr:uncharacterized protein M409DRAFT_21615 [Zasmidium cellare ATCC 36951]KAF2168171.1 hypothetical protein M409DRAFT_21615 [Zasmidium cellare ATCC 36951]